jgi:hypothetical protein
MEESWREARALIAVGIGRIVAAGPLAECETGGAVMLLFQPEK